MVRFKKFDWTTATFLILYHTLFLVSLPLYIIFYEQSLGLWLTMPILVVLCGIGISAGYHRHYSHRTFKMSKFVEIPLLLLGTLNIQNSVLKWSSDHRLHHTHVDTDKDPYSIKKGFWYAHFIWIIRSKGDNKYNPAVVHDLLKNKLVVFQHKYYLYLMILSNASVVFFFGWVFNDLVGAFVLLFLTRLFINHHTTWFINSLAHTWGIQPYSKEHTAVNNWIISLLTYGEGYHNYHHTFSGDYRNGVKWYQFDPTKIIIWSLSKVGLTSDLRTVDNTLIKQKLLVEDKKLMLDKIKKVSYVKWDVMEEEINRRADTLQRKLSDFRNLIREYKAAKRQEARKLRTRIRNSKKSIRTELRAWTKYCDEILRLKPTLA